MNQEIKKQWIEALRSGKYVQDRRCLRSEDGFCCLGVLCDIIDPAGWENLPGGRTHHSYASNPSRAIRNIAGIDDSTVDYLVELNDVAALPFSKIAAIIEEKL